MYEHMSLMFGRLISISLDDLKREDGQGATEYAMVVAFVIVGLTVTLGLLGTSIRPDLLGEVAGKIDALLSGACRRGQGFRRTSRCASPCGDPPEPHPLAVRGPGPESGQAVVEFAMVVPILCVLVLVLVDFGKGMNYWLDLNHVASEGARKACQQIPTAGEYQTYLLDRLETTELRAGGTDDPGGRDRRVCLPEGA